MSEQFNYPSRTYIPGTNDTWENIARVNGISVEVLLSINGLNTYEIDLLPSRIHIPIVPLGTQWELVMDGASGHYEPKLEADVSGADPVAAPETAKEQQPTLCFPPLSG